MAYSVKDQTCAHAPTISELITNFPDIINDMPHKYTLIARKKSDGSV